MAGEVAAIACDMPRKQSPSSCRRLVGGCLPSPTSAGARSLPGTCVSYCPAPPDMYHQRTWKYGYPRIPGAGRPQWLSTRLVLALIPEWRWHGWWRLLIVEVLKWRRTRRKLVARQTSSKIDNDTVQHLIQMVVLASPAAGIMLQS